MCPPLPAGDKGRGPSLCAPHPLSQTCLPTAELGVTHSGSRMWEQVGRVCRPCAGGGRCCLECGSLQTGPGPAPPVGSAQAQQPLLAAPALHLEVLASPRAGEQGCKTLPVPGPARVPQLKSGTLGPEEQTREGGKRSPSFHSGNLRPAPACSATAGQEKRLASRSCAQGGFFPMFSVKLLCLQVLPV